MHFGDGWASATDMCEKVSELVDETDSGATIAVAVARAIHAAANVAVALINIVAAAAVAKESG